MMLTRRERAAIAERNQQRKAEATTAYWKDYAWRQDNPVDRFGWPANWRHAAERAEVFA